MALTRVLKPQRLKKGDLIGIVTPASPVADASRIELGVKYLERNGYRVMVGENVGKVHGYLAGTDDERLADFHGMIADKRVKAIIAVRGGYGTPRLLSKLNYALVAKNPKVISGFSDLTALQLALWNRCRLVTFHGPMAGVEMANTIDPLTEELFWRMVTSSRKIGPLPLDPRPAALHGGIATGRLMGGNLSLIVSLLGTRYFPAPTGCVLFIEEIGEEPYRVDRMMTQLHNAGVLTKSSAVLTGQFTDCVPKDPTKPSLTIETLLSEAAKNAAKPFLSNLPFGHVPRKITLPVGLKVQVNADSASLTYLESAVR